MRILLVNPPRSPANAIWDTAPPETRPLIHRRLIGPPLGLLTLATAVRDAHEVHLLEMKGEYDLDPTAPAPPDLLRTWLDRVQPDLVGVTFIASEHPAGMALLRATRAWDPAVVTVAGGLHAQLCPEDFDDPAVDVLCTAQAPQVFRALVDTLDRDRHASLDAIGGLRVRRGGTLVPTPSPLPAWDLAGRDYLPPDRSLLTRWLPTYVVGRAPGPSTYLFTSLGCPYRCTFCSIWPQAGGAFHARGVESIVAELATLHDYPVVRFADGNSVVDPAHAAHLFDRIEAEGIRKTFIMDMRVDTAADHPDLVARLARGGLKVVIAGFESFRDEELDRFGKRLRADRIAEAVRIWHDHGILVRGNYVIPPTWDHADFDALAEHATRHRVALAGYTILTPMPGTMLHREMRADIVDPDLSKYNFFNCVTRTRLPVETFYARVGDLWRIRLGTEVI